MLRHRAGDELNSTFVSVIEPYQQKPFIKSIHRLDEGDDKSVAIKIKRTDGTSDFVMYNLSQTLMRLPNGIMMTGTAGYVQESGGKVKKGVLVNGTAL